MVKGLIFNNLKSLSKILALSFWWNRIIHPWDVDFSKSKATKFDGLGWVSVSNVWVAFEGRFASKEEMGQKFVLSLEEELGYEKNVTKLEEVWGGGLLRRGDNHCKEGDWIGLLEENKVLSSLVCHVSFTFKPKCSNNV